MKSKPNQDEDEVRFESDSEIESGQGALKKLREKLKKCTEEKQEYLDGWQRSKADCINIKKDFKKEAAEISMRTKEQLFLELLSVADSFTLAFQDKNAWKKVDKNWRVGVEHIYAQLEKVFSEHKIKEIGNVGDQFDPNIHTSVEKLITKDYDSDGKIAEVTQKGYYLEHRILRPAKVKIFLYKHNN